MERFLGFQFRLVRLPLATTHGTRICAREVSRFALGVQDPKSSFGALEINLMFVAQGSAKEPGILSRQHASAECSPWLARFSVSPNGTEK